MKIRTFSIIAGSMACNASCPGCIAGMTPKNGLTNKEPAVNWRRFHKACRLADRAGCTTAMITSKGEPTMFPRQITDFLEHMAPFDIPIIELQTNGSYIAEGKLVTDEHLTRWSELGLTTVAISVVSYDAEKNREVYFPRRKQYFDLPKLIEKLRKFDYTVRLTTILAKGYIDSVDEMHKLLDFAREHKVDQLTCTPITKPELSELASMSERLGRGETLSREDTIRASTFKWTADHQLPENMVETIKRTLDAEGHLLQRLAHGALVYDVKGQNICLSNCITIEPGAEELRSIIFFPDGKLRYAWQHEGSIIF